MELRERLAAQEASLKELTSQTKQCREDLERERAVGRLTDNQEVISGIQAFVRLMTQAGQTA